MFRCLTDGPETWVIAPTDWPSRDQCGGRVWIDVSTARGSQARMDTGACSGAAGGVRFDSGFGVCSIDNLQNLNDHSELVVDSAVHIACALLRSFGAHTVRALDVTRPAAESAPMTNVTIRLAHSSRSTGVAPLFGDLVVRKDEYLRLEADNNTSLATIVLGAHQLRVEAGGTLELVRV